MHKRCDNFAPVMMVCGLALAVFVLAGCEAPPDEISLVNWHEDYDDALQAAAQAEKPIFVDFFSPRCGPCIQMSRDVFSVQAVADVLNNDFIPLKIDATANGVLATRYSVSFVPTLVVIDSKGAVVDKVTGFRDADQFLDFLAQAKDKWAEQ